MSALWTDVATRARGLATHFLSRATLEALSSSADLAALADGLRGLGRVPIGAVSPQDLELALRRGHARQLEVLARWCGPRAERLPLVFEAEDLRSLRRLVRLTSGVGAGQDAALGSPLAGLIPTPTLPERALATLAEQPNLKSLTTLLGFWRHPFAPAVQAAASDKVDLFTLDRALESAFASRVVAAAEGEGHVLADATARYIDAANARILLVLAQAPRATRDEGAFLPGGRILTRERFDRFFAAPTPSEMARHLADAFGHSPLAEPFRAQAAQARSPSAGLLLTTVESDLFSALLRVQRHEALRDPLGLAPILTFALGLRVEAVDLATLVWGFALGAPRITIASALVTP